MDAPDAAIPEPLATIRRQVIRGAKHGDDFCLVALPADWLPSLHHPYKCSYLEEFSARGAAGFREYVDRLERTDQLTCPYHAGDWEAIGREALRHFVDLAERPDAEGEAGRPGRARDGERLGLSDSDREWLASLFGDPISISLAAAETEPQIYNGQHRLCALLAARTPRVVVEIGYQNFVDHLACRGRDPRR